MEVLTVVRNDEMDDKFLAEISALGGESIRKCYQCGSCTANCPLTARIKAFPRRTLRLIQLGLVERALRSPDMWLCSACSTCKAACPRQADPGEIMAALRRYAYSKYSWLPSSTRDLMTSTKLIVALAAVFSLILSALIYLTSQMSWTGTTVNYAAFLPFSVVDTAGLVLGLAVSAGVLLNTLRMWRMVGGGWSDTPQLTVGRRLKSFVNVIVREIALQKTIRKCNTGRLQWTAHLSLVAGFIGAAITTMFAFVLNPGGNSFPLDNPVKILGNLSAALLLFGATAMIARRLFQKSIVGKTLFQDGLFLSLLFIVALTGTLSESARLLNAGVIAYLVYSAHLVSVALLLALAPYAKFAHAIYRPLAMYVAKLRGWPD
jgi:nitrate reductase gamma subunit